MCAVVILEGRVHGAVAVFALERVTFVQIDLASPGRGGAPGPERTAAAGCAERDSAFRGDSHSDAVRAGHGAAASTVKLSKVNPPSTAGRNGQGLITVV